MRKLATVRRISALEPILGADNIETASVDGWKVVVKKQQFQVGDLCVYIEIDSWVPHKIAPFLTGEGKEPKVYKGVDGQRLRTVKLRKQLSQGLILPISALTPDHTRFYRGYNEDEDVTDVLGIVKYDLEADSIQSDNRKVRPKGVFPTHLVPKTDQERIQNCFYKLPRSHTWEATLKLDGSSCTIFVLDGELRVCSRNLELATKSKLPWWRQLLVNCGWMKQPPAPDNPFVKMALQVESSVRKAEGIAFQGELMGPGIQKNREEFEKFRWFIYDAWSIRERRYLAPTERRELAKSLELEHVPLINNAAMLYDTAEGHLVEANATKSINHTIGEGIVYKSNDDSSISFKAISNRYLLKEE